MSKKSKLEKKEKAKVEKEKHEVPVLKNPANKLAGKIVIWILLILMSVGGLSGIIYAIVKSLM